MKSAATILVLEDDFVSRRVLESQLTHLGIRKVRGFESVSDALDFLDRDAPCFALLDYNLERGETSAKVARKLSEKGVPFIFLTGLGVLTDDGHALSNVPCFEKPMGLDELRDQLADRGLLPN